MQQLVYISTSRRDNSGEFLRDILSTSRINNDRVGITGLLVSGGTRFLQVLEGPTKAVLETYERIERDSRHFATVILSSKSVPSQAFGNWSMAFHQGPRGSDGSLREVVRDMTENLSDLALQAEFRRFAKLHDLAA